MKDFINIISQPWLGSVLGIAGLVAAVFFFRKSRRNTRLAYQRDSVSLVGGADAAFPDELSIQYSGKVVPRVTAEKIVVWNSGNTTIGASQIVNSDALRIETGENGDLLKTRVLRTSRDVNGFAIKETEKKEKQRLLHFDFLDPGDGFAIEIIHSGSRKDLSIEGTIMGMPDGLKDYGRFSLFHEKTNRKLPFPLRYKRLPFIVMILLGLGMASAGLLKPQFIDLFPSLAEPKEPKDPRRIEWVFVIGGMLYAGMPSLMFWMRRKRFPSELDVSEDEKESGEPDAGGNG